MKEQARATNADPDVATVSDYIQASTWPQHGTRIPCDTSVAAAGKATLALEAKEMADFWKKKNKTIALMIWLRSRH